MNKNMKNSQIVSILSLLYVVFLRRLQAELLVKISQGPLKGTTFETSNGRKISAFLGIPYAEPPVGELRFSNPVPEKPWNEIRLVDKEANVCYQKLRGKIQGDEDCLHLNVYTPVQKFNSSIVNSEFEKTLLPVMVWIHGGGFQSGSSRPTSHSPSHLLDKNILLVSMNYRLGIFGFLSTGDSVAPGNFGLKDQVLALKWVQQHIKSFGGNPKKVTIFGESAGGASVNFHALSNATNGLFHQYIIQSGSALSPWAYRNRSHFKPYLDEVAEKVQCPIINSKDFINCLRKTSADKLVNAVVFVNENFPLLPWTPTDELESEEAFLTDSPQNLIAQNKMKDHPFICGTVVDEGLLVTLKHYVNKTSRPINHLLEKCINSTSNHYVKPDNFSLFRKIIQEHYFQESINSLPKDKLLKNFTTFVGDSGFLYPQVILIEKVAKIAKSPFYFYSFGYLSLNMSRIFLKFNVKEHLGVCHGEDISYLFPKASLKEISKNDEKILNLVIDLWTSFAINGKPTSDELDDPDLWLPYAENKSFLQIGNIFNNTDPSVTLEQNYFTPRMNFWKKHFPVL